MDIKTLFGLPAHPLLVHIPIVLIPLVAIGGIAIAVSPRMRERFGILTLVLAVVAFIGTWLASQSGEALTDSVRRSAALHQHIDLAGKMKYLALLLLAAVFGILLFDRLTKQGRKFPAATNAVAIVLMIVIAVGSTGWLVAIGHNGAQATWQNVHVKSGGGDQGLPAPSRGR